MAILLSLVFLATPIAFAEEVVAEPNLTIEEVEEITDSTNSVDVVDAGITPDQDLLWGMERLQEKVSLMLTFNKLKKAEKSLKYAKERLQEMKKVAESGKANVEDIAKAEKVHAELIADASEDIAEAESDNIDGSEESAEVKELKETLDNHIQVLEKVRMKLEAKGVPTQGIENALFRATQWKESREQLRTCLSEANESGEGVKEQARACFEESKQVLEQNREQLRENKEEAVKEKIKERPKIEDSSETEQTSDETATEEVEETQGQIGQEQNRQEEA